MPEETGRRTFVQLVSGVALSSGVGGLSGCSAIQDGSGPDGTATPTSDAQGSGSGTIEGSSDWVYEPDEFQPDADRLSVRVRSYSEFLSNQGSLQEDTYLQAAEHTWPELGIDPEDVDMDVELPDGEVLTGSFDAGAVKEELRSSGGDESDTNEFESDGTYADTYELFVRADQDYPSVAYAIGDGTIIRGNRVPNYGNDSDAVSAEDVVTGILDIGTGDDYGLIDTNSDFNKLVDAFDTDVSLSFGLLEAEVGSDDGPEENIDEGRFEGVVFEGISLAIDGATTTVQYVFVYRSEEQVDEGDIDDWVKANDTGDGEFADLDEISVSIDGATATVTGTLPTNEL